MAVTLTLEQLRNGVRAGASVEETEILERILSAATEAVNLYAPTAPVQLANEATVRLAGYLFDQPNAPARGTNALRHSGASALLSQWRVQRLSLVTTGEDGEPSSTSSLTGEELAGLLDDYLGSQDWRQGGVSGVTDAVARAAAAAAQTTRGRSRGYS